MKENPMPTATATSNPPKKLKAGTEYRIPHTAIIIKENIRGDANKIDPKMLASIKENGVTSPLMVTPDYVHIDGERRIHCCNELAKLLNVPYIEVPVIVRDVPESQIPIIQFTLGYERKNISTADTNRAVFLHAERNPNVQLKELADLFHISKTSAFRCVRIQKAPTLNKLVAESKLTQNAALTVIDHFLSQAGVNEENDYDEDDTQKALLNAEDLGKALEANIAANTKLDKDNKEVTQTAWHLRNINTYLNSVGKPPIETKKNSEKLDNKRFNLAALVQGMLDSFIISPIDDDKVSFNGTLTLEQFEALKELTQEKKKGELFEIDNNNVDQDTYITWKEYNEHSPSSIIFVQDSITRYRSYEGSVQILEEILKIEPSYTNGIKHNYLAIAKNNMRTVTTQLLNKGWNVVRVNKENAKNRLKSATPTTEFGELDATDKQIQEDLEAISKALEKSPESPVVNTSKLQEKLNTAPVFITDEDSEFDLLQNGNNFEEFIEGIEEDES